MSVVGAKAENICSQRVFRLLTHIGHRGALLLVADCLSIASSQRARRGLVSSVALRLLSGQSSHDEGILRRMTNVPGSLQRTPNIGIFRATIKGDQPHAIRTLNLITVLEPIGLVVCGFDARATPALWQTSLGLFDYWGCPWDRGDEVAALVKRLRREGSH